MAMERESFYRRRRTSLTWLASCLIIIACWYILVFWSPLYPEKTVIKFKDTKISAHIKDVVANEDGTVDVILRLDEKLEVSRSFLNNVSMSKEKHMATTPKFTEITKREIVTKTHYPVTLTSPYVINNANICAGVKNLTFLIIVHSAPGHFQRRRSLRETWANKNAFKNIKMRIVFLFGMASDRKTQVFIENESTVYKDIVQGNFKDSYKNLTHKGVLGYRWISEHCNSSKMVLKVDDDVFVNIFKIVDYYLPKYGIKPKQILCHVRKEGTSPILHGSTKLKWGVGEDDFRGQKFYPTYCNGYAVFMTPDLITGMYRAAHLTPFFWVDDVYLFGLLPKKIGGAHWENIVNNFTLNQKVGLESYESEAPSKYVVTSAWQDGVMERLWFAALSRMTESNKKMISDELRIAVDEMVKQKAASDVLRKAADAAKKAAEPPKDQKEPVNEKAPKA